MMADIYGNRYCALRVSLPSCMRHFISMLVELASQFESAPILKGELVLVVEGADKHATQVSIEKIERTASRSHAKNKPARCSKRNGNLSGSAPQEIYQLALSISKN